MDSNLVEIKTDEHFIIDMMYATLKKNITGVAVYEEIGLGNRAFVHCDLWEKLQQVIPYLKQRKLKLKIGDAYRPAIAHKRLLEIIPYSGFFAATPELSQHCRGTAIDVCLCSEQGIEFEYPTKMDAFDEKYAKEVQEGKTEEFFEYLQKARHDYVTGCTSLAIKNRQELKRLMESIGLSSIKHEWWHYNLPNGCSEQYPLIEFK